MKVDLRDFPHDYGTVVSNPTLKEHNRSFTLDNRSRYLVKKWRIDKVVFKDSTEERCDYLLEVQKHDKFVYYWIELKGKDLVKACRQILNAIRLIDVSEAAEQQARVITTGTSKIDILTLDFVKLDNFMRSKKGRLRAFTNERTEII